MKTAGPPPEFLALREYYDRHAREEAPLAGYDEYRQCRAARLWPGLEAVREVVGTLAGHDDAWQRGFAPGLGKFLRERQWLKKPALPRHGKAEGGCPSARPQTGRGGDPAMLRNLSTAAKILARRQGEKE